MTQERDLFQRRDLWGRAVAIGAASMLGERLADAGEETEQTVRAEASGVAIVDTNVSLFHWPFRRLPLDDCQKLVARFRSLGIAQAWAGSFEGLLHRDLSSVNRRLADACDRHPELLPIGSINPTLPDWQSDMRACFQEHAMPGVRLHPNYHGYELSDPSFRQLIQDAAAANRFVQIAVTMEDTRTQHPLVRVSEVDLNPLADILKQIKNARIQVLNYRPKSSQLQAFAGIPNLWFDTARVEGTDGIRTMLSHVPTNRLLFGSHAPFLIPEAALMRLDESELTDAELRALLWEASRGYAS